MGNTWLIQFNEYHVYFRICICIRLYYIENSHQQDNSWSVYIDTANALETAQITIVSELSYFPCFLSVHG